MKIHIWKVLLVILCNASGKVTGIVHGTFYAALLHRDPSATATLSATMQGTGSTKINLTISGTCESKSYSETQNVTICEHAFPFKTGITKNGGLILNTTSDKEITVQVSLKTGDKAEGYTVYPYAVLGMEYYVTTFCAFVSTVCQFAVLASEANTYLMIDFSPSSFQRKNQSDPNNTITVKLSALDVLHLESTRSLTGVHITSNKPVAVFAGSRSNISGDPNHFIEQLLPVKLWGSEFILKSGLSNTGDLIQIIAGERNTKVEITGYPTFIMPEKGQCIQRRLEKGLLYHVVSDYPIQISQFLSIDLYNKSISSPTAMLIVNPVQLSAETFAFSCVARAKLTMIIKKQDIWNNSNGSYTNFTLEPVQGSLYAVVEAFKQQTTINGDDISGIEVNGGYVTCNDSGVMPITYAMKPFAFGCHETVMHVGDMRDNDCDGEVDEDTCTNDDLTTRFSLLQSPIQFVVEFRYFPYKENDYLRFRVRSCGIVMFTVKDMYNSRSFILMILRNSDFSVTVCNSSCNYSSQPVKPVNNCMEEYRNFTIFVDETDIKVTFENSELSSVPLDGKIFRKIGFGTLLQQADFDIDASTKDCSGMLPDIKYSLSYIVIFPPSPICVTEITSAKETEVRIREFRSGSAIESRNYGIIPLESIAWNRSDEQNWTCAIVSANTELFVSTFCKILNKSKMVSFASLPTALMGTHFILMNTHYGDYICAFATAGVPAKVFIVFANKITTKTRSGSCSSTDTYECQFYLYKYGVYWIRSDSDFTGSVVRSDNPIAVSCGSFNASYPTLVPIPPVEAFGTEFNIPDIGVGLPNMYNATLKVMSGYDGTNTLKSSVYDQSYDLDKIGEIIQIEILSKQNFILTATKPVLLLLSFVGSIGSSVITVLSTEQYSAINFIPQVQDGYTQKGSSWVQKNGTMYSHPNDSNRSEHLPSSRQYPDGSVIFGFTVFILTSSELALIPGNVVNKAAMTCRLSPVEAGDQKDNDCDGLKDEEHCFIDIPSGNIDYDLDGSWNEDCSSCQGNRSGEEPYSIIPCGTRRNKSDKRPVCESSGTSVDLGGLGSSTQINTLFKTGSADSTELVQISTPTTVQDSSTVTAVNNTQICECNVPCAWAWNRTISEEEVKQEVKELKKKLAVKKDELSATIRKNISIKDFRPSATSLGILGIALLTLTFGTILVLDITSIVRDFRMLRENLVDMWNY